MNSARTTAQDRVRTAARITLAGIRFFNGSVSLFAPRLFAQRLGIVAISAFNTALSLLLQGSKGDSEAHPTLVPKPRERGS